MKTRKDYLDGKCSFEDYYSQFVTPATKAVVKNHIGLKRIKASTDKHLNDIPLKEWDRLANAPVFSAAKMNEAGDYLTLSGQVCILKQSARELIA